MGSGEVLPVEHAYEYDGGERRSEGKESDAGGCDGSGGGTIPMEEAHEEDEEEEEEAAAAAAAADEDDPPPPTEVEEGEGER